MFLLRKKTEIATTALGNLKKKLEYILSIKIISDCFSFLRHPLFLSIVIKKKVF